MRYRKLRIAWSVAWGIAFLWLTTRLSPGTGHSNSDWTWLFIGNYGLETVSESGHFTFRIADPSKNIRPWRSSHQDGKCEMTFVGDEIRPRYRVRWDGPTLVMDVPAYVSFTTLALMAAIPWLPHRFSLRTLLIATTLIAAILGLAVYAVK